MPEQKVTLTVGDESVELPVSLPTHGQPVVGIGPLVQQGYFTHDPGFVGTSSCESKITYIDGGKGILLHRGYPIDQLAENKSFLEVSYLLLHGELPSEAQKDDFEKRITDQREIAAEVKQLATAFTHDAHPMAIIMAMLAQKSALELPKFDIESEAYRLSVAETLIAKIATYVAIAYRHTQKLPFIEPDPNAGYAKNFLHMLFSDTHPELVTDQVADAMDKIFTLHADHEQNASTSAVRLVGSTQTNPYAAISAGVAALWGPSHGGANEACLKMLNEIGSVDRIPEFVEKAKDKNDPFKLMGFGHRVYKSYDPRAKIMHKTCHEILEATGGADKNPLLQIAVELERIAREDPYFVERNLYPNVDFYSGITLSAMGIPVELFTPIFVLGRTAGWISQWHEMLSEPYKIGRPRQLYTGEAQRDL